MTNDELFIQVALTLLREGRFTLTQPFPGESQQAFAHRQQLKRDELNDEAMEFARSIWATAQHIRKEGLY